MSEIILQQTRIEQGLPYYERFVEKFPTVHDLASAPEQEVMKTWEGLGYYSRARNLHTTAKFISQSLEGKFPDNYEGLIKLKGVGPYTAAAIASISFNEATPVLDGNVFRFISRMFGVEKDIADTKNRKYFLDILNELIQDAPPADFNQATMEFGATVCSPKPSCESCNFQTSCFAFREKKQSVLPIKSKKVKIKEQFIDYFIITHGEKSMMRRRGESIWHGLYEFPSEVSEQPIELNKLLNNYKTADKIGTSETVKHLLTHRRLWVKFHEVSVSDINEFEQISKDLSFSIYSWEEILTLPLPKVITNHLQRVGF